MATGATVASALVGPRRHGDHLMRYGVLADIHGNAHALEAAVAALEAADVDSYLCLGDLVGFGPKPNECVARVAALDATIVAGNHDLIAVGRLTEDGCSRLARDTLRWTTSVLQTPARRYLEGLPLVAQAPGGILLAHGALGDPRRYVSSPADAAQQLREMTSVDPTADVLLLGHTHAPMAFAQRAGPLSAKPGRAISLPADEHVILNPGSVGQSRQRLARAQVMVLDRTAGTATFLSVEYDVDGCRRELRRHGLPTNAHHRRPYGVRALGLRARSTARRLRDAAMR